MFQLSANHLCDFCPVFIFASAVTLTLTVVIANFIQISVKLRPSGAMRLRTCGYDYELPAVKYDLNKQNFIVRSVF